MVYIFVGGFTGGVLFHSFFNLGFSFSLFILLLASSLFVFFQYFGKTRKKSTVLLIPLLLFGVSLGLLRFDVADLKQGSVFLTGLVGERIVGEGIVVDEPDERENHTKLTVTLDSVFDEEVKSKILITADSYQKFLYGDRISIEGILLTPKKFKSDRGGVFDYPAFLSKDGIFYLMFYPEVTLISSGGGNSVKRTLFSFKFAFLERIGRVIPEPQASLLGGLVVGAKQSLGEELQDDFRKTGIIHIVVLSGYNVTIVAEAIMRFFSFLPYALSLSLGAFIIVLFAIMTGASATIVRASIMALLVLLARATGRAYTMTYALFIAGFFMILHNPKILVFDSSFQLSFMATLGLIYLAPKLEEYFKLVPTKWQLREFATATIATQLFVLPILLYKMGELSLVAVPVNMLVLIFVPITMLFGFLTGMFGFLSTFLSLPFAYISNALLSYELWIVDIFASLPFASVQIDTFPLWAVILLYAMYGLLIFYFMKRRQISFPQLPN